LGQDKAPEEDNQTIMSITSAEIKHVARLARLTLSDNEQELFASQMSAILSYAETLNELDTDGITPTAHAVPVENAFRPDVAQASIGIAKALHNAPDRVETFFRVPPVIE
jgi:aspartyl-tRNA(Asn)/glutamyl-tRNA(Gln) amidotransferase subunit C